jgi:hypothetical protein
VKRDAKDLAGAISDATRRRSPYDAAFEPSRRSLGMAGEDGSHRVEMLLRTLMAWPRDEPRTIAAQLLNEASDVEHRETFDGRLVAWLNSVNVGGIPGSPIETNDVSLPEQEI